jgi:FlaA1/EpsC-like NDP-sugar epimerase
VWCRGATLPSLPEAAISTPRPILRNRWLALADLVVLALGILVGYLTRFEGAAGWEMLSGDLGYLILGPVAQVGILWLGGIYRVIWRHSSSRDFLHLGVVATVSGFIGLVLGAFILAPLGIIHARVPLSVLALVWLVTILGPAILRASLRLSYIHGLPWRAQGPPVAAAGGIPNRRARRILIAGAGEAGRLIVEEFRRQRSGERIELIGFIDRDHDKHDRTVVGLPVLGEVDQLGEVVRSTRANELVIAMPSVGGEVVREYTNAARANGLQVRTLPALVELATGKVTTTALRPVEIADLLRREPIDTDFVAVRALVAGKRVLITGAGGSIGSELCRQVARLEPTSIALLGHGENSIFDIRGELRRYWPDLSVAVYIADVRHRARMTAVFEHYRPELVFHAAAHKHVRLMEENPAEAVTNNVIGTLNVAELAAQVGVERLVMISTDKAVRPTSVMGASKRIAEQVVQLVAERSGSNFVAVRFGNVLGSRGSVVPTFLKQIATGGPLTLTHPEVRRFFMTIPEAVQLVLQAAALGQGGEVFALDMGKAVKIVDLATDLVRLSGLEPGHDIDLVYTGLLPGEKLYEEVFFEGDEVTVTSHPKILRTAAPAAPALLIEAVRRLEAHAEAGAAAAELRGQIGRLVPDYQHTEAVAPPVPNLPDAIPSPQAAPAA